MVTNDNEQHALLIQLFGNASRRLSLEDIIEVVREAGLEESCMGWVMEQFPGLIAEEYAVQFANDVDCAQSPKPKIRGHRGRSYVDMPENKEPQRGRAIPAYKHSYGKKTDE